MGGHVILFHHFEADGLGFVAWEEAGTALGTWERKWSFVKAPSETEHDADVRLGSSSKTKHYRCLRRMGLTGSGPTTHTDDTDRKPDDPEVGKSGSSSSQGHTHTAAQCACGDMSCHGLSEAETRAAQKDGRSVNQRSNAAFYLRCKDYDGQTPTASTPTKVKDTW